MTDRELLEFAAKAAGYSCWQSKHGYLNVTRPDGSTFTACHNWPKFDNGTGEKLPEPGLADALNADNWNPLTDDGDRWRLAAACKLAIDFELGQVFVPSPEGVYLEYSVENEERPLEWCAVRAAAEIGRALP